MLRCLFLIATFMFVNGTDLSAQTPAPSPARYDVVSIRQNTSSENNTRWRYTDSSFIGTDVTLTNLLANAFDTRADLISGLPEWAKTEHFDINAKAVDSDSASPRKLTVAQSNAMIAQLLAERFQLKIHPETRELPVYDLVVGKGGSRLKPNAAVMVVDPAALPKPGMRPGMIMMGRGEFMAEAVSLAPFIQSLARELQRNVIDKTGLTGNFDIHLKWTPDNSSAGPGASPDSGQSDAPPPLFTAIQDQLGLKLVPAKGPVQTWVVDHVEHPTEN